MAVPIFPNGVVGNVVPVSGATYLFNLTPSGQGLVTTNMAAGAVTDFAGNGNTAAASFSRQYIGGCEGEGEGEGECPFGCFCEIGGQASALATALVALAFFAAIVRFFMGLFSFGLPDGNDVETNWPM